MTLRNVYNDSYQCVHFTDYDFKLFVHFLCTGFIGTRLIRVFARRTKTVANEQLGEVWPSCNAIVTIVTDLAEVLIDADELSETVCKC